MPKRCIKKQEINRILTVWVFAGDQEVGQTHQGSHWGLRVGKGTAGALLGSGDGNSSPALPVGEEGLWDMCLYKACGGAAGEPPGGTPAAPREA